MKRYVNCAQDKTLDVNQYDHITFYHGRKMFAANIRMIQPHPLFEGYVYQPHPYDDADYTMAYVGRRGIMNVEFVRDRRIIGRMQCHLYEEEDYERPEDYVNDILDQIAVEILDLDRDVKPRMMYD